MTCSTLSAIITSALPMRYGRKPEWRSAANDCRGALSGIVASVNGGSFIPRYIAIYLRYYERFGHVNLCRHLCTIDRTGPSDQVAGNRRGGEARQEKRCREQSTS